MTNCIKLVPFYKLGYYYGTTLKICVKKGIKIVLLLASKPLESYISRCLPFSSPFGICKVRTQTKKNMVLSQASKSHSCCASVAFISFTYFISVMQMEVNYECDILHASLKIHVLLNWIHSLKVLAWMLTVSL